MSEARRTIRKLIAAGLAAAAAVMVPVSSATASTQAAPHCQFGSGYGYLVDSDPIYSPPGNHSASVGRIELCRDSGYQYWAFILLDNPPTVSQYGDAEIARYRDGNVQNVLRCESPGGNGEVLPGQRRCWTPKIDGVSGHYKFIASGTLWSSHTGNLLADGYVALTR
ncbi:Uncharacterised protein [Amycolatopsis camponoti]|uniref:Uncharacterized protein n=1 Tax=Amycolatopsis camponoti TaxID=2606593 RepID=A0A6I8LN38_9PSEU|nr:hypothetical protein [Amycolatopsis camponoti]VVJ17848.1 Uncharacterised protein [Amycolatopsis camponoti]